MGGVYIFIPQRLGFAVSITIGLCILALIVWLVARNIDYRKDNEKLNQLLEEVRMSNKNIKKAFQIKEFENGILQEERALTYWQISTAAANTKEAKLASIESAVCQQKITSDKRLLEYKKIIEGVEHE